MLCSLDNCKNFQEKKVFVLSAAQYSQVIRIFNVYILLSMYKTLSNQHWNNLESRVISLNIIKKKLEKKIELV